MLKPFLHRQLAMGLALGLGIGLSILATSFVSNWEMSNRQTRFQRQTENLKTALQRSLNRYTDMLASLGDYYAVEQVPVSRQSFARFVTRSLRTHPGVQGLEWAPLLRRTERLAYEQNIRAEGYPNFQITELSSDGRLIRAAERPFYIPVTYLEPFTGNESAFGYDLNSDRVRATAIAKARDTGTITATGRIRLVQEKRDQFGFLVFLPVYENPQPSTSISLVSRDQELAGVLLGVFRVSDVVEEALQDFQSEIDFAVYDQSAEITEQFLGQYDALRQQVTTVEHTFSNRSIKAAVCPSMEHCSQTLSVGRRQWLITFSPSANYPLETQYGAIATLISGLLLTSGLVLFLHYLNRELEQTQSLSELRFRFFSMASHELRTPLSIILLSSESLQLNQDQFTEDQKKANIQRIYLTAKRMSQQITDLLMLTRAEVKQLEFQPELCDLEPFCQQILDEMQMGMSQPILFSSTGQSTQAFLDKKLLQSLLTNLLSNAAKYSPLDSPIQFHLSCDGNIATLQIRDHGIGILLAEQSQVSQPFYRGSNVGQITGTGLGLAIVKACVDLHQGKWTIESQPGEGTTVTVVLPLE